jgi:glycosyltransferase involved in cell wall biosynthesis
MSQTIPSEVCDCSPQVAIITIVKNNELGLKATLNSILRQSFENWVSFIVVGESSDSTLGVAERFADSETRASVVIQEDTGIYEAMNLGSKKAGENSKYLIYMNAGDQFRDSHALDNLVQAIEKKKVGVVIGGYQIKNGETYSQNSGKLSQFRFTFTRRGGCHQSMIYSAKILKTLNYYNVDFRIASDHDLTLRAIKLSKGYRIPETVSIVEGNGISDNNLLKLHQEKQEIREKHFGRRSMITLLGVLWKNVYIAKKLLGSKLQKL